MFVPVLVFMALKDLFDLSLQVGFVVIYQILNLGKT